MSSRSNTKVVPFGRLARRRAKTRRDLLLAARRAFAARGYDHTKVSDIAAAADIGVGTFYLYFNSKESLFVELVRDTTRRLKATMDAARTRAKDAEELTRVSCAEFFRFARDNKETFSILFGEGIFNKPIVDAQREFISDLAGTIAEGVRAGLFAPYPPPLMAQAIIGTLTQVVSWWIAQDEVSLQEVVEATNRFIASGLLLGASKPKRRR